MNKIRVSKRLEQIAKHIPRDTVLVDIGTDHALLPVYAIQHGFVQRAVAGDINEGPIRAAKKQISRVGLEGKVDIKQGNGLEIVPSLMAAGEQHATIVVAGMGGSLIRDILETGKHRLQTAHVQRLILQPNVGEHHIREWLLEASEWYLVSEEILEEDGKIYEILVADRNADSKSLHGALYKIRPFSDLGIVSDSTQLVFPEVLPIIVPLRMGPYLLRNPNEIWFEKWDLEWKKHLFVMKQLEKSDRTDVSERKKRRAEEWNTMREVWKCLLKLKQL